MVVVQTYIQSPMLNEVDADKNVIPMVPHKDVVSSCVY